ncbi:S-protein homolog 5-like [Diospyros lotus]|uniref:S-protein homolog 5-like n=1 Tax=Diospyros lotus TaxID=55363 RepID=UPI002252063F|nr:S-protein homolog 5-like [Diospyros lotus]
MSFDQRADAPNSFWAVHVTNNIPADQVKVRCKTKDDDFGLKGNQTLLPGYELWWRFSNNGLSQNTVFFCNFYWGSKDQVFNVFDSDISRHCTSKHAVDDSCYWSIRRDGFYFSGTNETGSYEKWHDWKYNH